MSWIFLALLAPLISAIVNIFDDNLLGKIYKGALVAAVISGLFGILPAIFILLLRPASINAPGYLIGLSVLSGILVVFAFYAYFKGLEKADPSVVAALLCITPAVIPFVAYFAVGERLTINAVLGFSIVIVAAFLFSLADVRKLTISKAMVPALIAAALFDTVAITNKFVYTKIDFINAYLYFSIGMFIAGLILLFVSLKKQSTKQNLWDIVQKRSPALILLLMLVEALALLAELARNKALSLGDVSLVAGLQNLQPFYVLIISLLFFPFYPKVFRSAQSVNLLPKLLLALAMCFGVFVAVK
jgi:drug/metabolite transporter (DMT)-like permease